MKKIISLLSFLSFVAFPLVAQVEVEEEEPQEEPIFEVVEDSPTFPGGEDSIYAFIKHNLVYPEEDFKAGTEGTVYVQFVVEKDGSLSNFKVLRGQTEAMNAEALRVIKSMPKWRPGKQRGKAVRCRFILPVRFRLSDHKNKQEGEKVTIIEIIEDDIDIDYDDLIIEEATNDDAKGRDSAIFHIVENEPTFPGGKEKLVIYIEEHIQYPDKALEQGIEGVVYVRFIVEPDSTISNCKVLRGVQDCPSLDREALRLVNTMPKWIPGKQRGKKVRCYYTIPVKFIIKDQKKNMNKQAEEVLPEDVVYFEIEEEEVVEDTTVFYFVEEPPSFPGGEETRKKFLIENISMPQKARNETITGTVYVRFVVEKDGSISNIEIVRSPHECLSEEAIRVIKLMPKWSPGKQRGKPVRCYFTIPIKFVVE